MKCPNCGEEISSGEFSCPYCGVRKECRACASWLWLGASFCHFCGSNWVVLRKDPKREKAKDQTEDRGRISKPCV